MPLDSADAVRFSVIDDTGGWVKITWVTEKDHVPVEFGTLEYREGQLSGASPLLTAQALAFVKSYVAEPGAKALLATNAHE